ncbi:hypothetical protein K438DRAFT_1914729 [Mycena galopus ATCC 62051]|nr:hypothetical protein K438DRAFT_1914729 [Mycena galopus ATCC 62051]
MTSQSVFRLLNNPRFNKGTAFTVAERKAFGLTGRLPSRVNTLDEQCERAYAQLESRMKYSSLKAQNLVLYYTLLTRHLRELIPIIYTPTEAEAISNYSHLFRRSEGLYLTKKYDLIVCSDSEAILGIGDQGVGISEAKSIVGGIDPSQSLSVVLDVGTDNKDLLDDHLYVGWPHERVRGEEYDKFVDKFVQLVRKYFPQSLLHFEDFGRYSDSHAVFNDDIQGTGAVTLSCLMAAVGVTKTKLSEQRFIIYGAGITRQLRDAAVSIDSISVEEANSLFYLIDKHGLIKQSLGPANIREDLHEFVRSDEEWAEVKENGAGEIGLLETIKKVKPTVLIGCSTHAGAFTEEVVKAMADGCERPIILPLSNPSKLVEVDPKDANDWTHGKALLATGSPFPPAKMPNGKDYVYFIYSSADALIYPGLGFGAIVTKSRRMTDTMILPCGARRLASLSPALKDPDDALLPDFADAPDVNFEVAVAVAEQAVEEGSADVHWTKEEAREKVRQHVWRPLYGEFVFDKEHGMA